jgi:hypothetical protein
VKNKSHDLIVGALLVLLVCGRTAVAQEPAKSRPEPVTHPATAGIPQVGTRPGPVIPLRVQIVVSRYLGEKRVSSLPYMLAVNANDGMLDPSGAFLPSGGPARIRSGAEIPIATLAIPKGSPVKGPQGAVDYKGIGTNIDCTATSTDDGRFKVSLSIDDTSVYPEGQTAQGVAKLEDVPSFRSFQSHNALILREGQSEEFTATADKITGEVTKIVVTVMRVK